MLQSRPLRWVLGGLAVVLLLGIGYVGGLITPTLTAPGNNSPEAGFARDMSTHHAQAVSMGLLEIENGQNPDIKGLAHEIVTAQQAEIGTMQEWLTEWHLLPTSDQRRMAWMPGPPVQIVNGLMPGMASTAEMNELTTTTGKAEDILFCQLMLRHHEGGIHMAEGIIELTGNSEVKALAQSMVAGQQAEILDLTNYLKQLGAAPLTS